MVKAALPLMFALTALTACSGQSPEQLAADEAAAKKEREDGMAAFINMKGYLCAEVLMVGPEIPPGERQVNCKEWRDPKKAKAKFNVATYMVNLSTATVRLIGRN